MNLGNPIAQGNTAAIYLSGNKIIKVFADYLPDGQAVMEAGKQRLAWEAGLAVPEILEVTRIHNRQAIVMEYIPGDTLGNSLAGDTAGAETYMRIAVETQLKIHAVKGDGFPSMRDKLASQIASAGRIGAGQKAFLLEKLSGWKEERSLCHGDFHLYNIIMCGGEPYMIDWVDASWGDIRADVCRSFLLYREVSEELAALYLRLYSRYGKMDEENILAWMPVIAGARLAEHISLEQTERLLAIVNEVWESK